MELLLVLFIAVVALTQLEASSLTLLQNFQVTGSNGCKPVFIKNGRVRLRSRGRIAKYICAKGFQILGEKYSTCLRRRWDTPPPVCISTGCSIIKEEFNHGQILESYRGALVKFYCNPGFRLEGSPSLYCNGAVWNSTVPDCNVIQTSNVQKWCDFESEDLCGWTQDLNHDFDWRRHNFATPSGHLATGPAYDHTLGPGLDGHYMYLEASDPRLQNDTARLFSPVFPPIPDNDSCFIFWYNMYGSQIGTLQVYLHAINAFLVFSKSGNQGNRWVKAVVRLPLTFTSFQIVVEGVRGSGFVGDIAFDDVKLAEGDECMDEISTGSTVEPSGSCEGRCHQDTPPEATECDCSVHCFEHFTCCPDYISLCSPASSPTVMSPVNTTIVDKSDVNTTIVDKSDVNTILSYITRETITPTSPPTSSAVSSTGTKQTYTTSTIGTTSIGTTQDLRNETTSKKTIIINNVIPTTTITSSSKSLMTTIYQFKTTQISTTNKPFIYTKTTPNLIKPITSIKYNLPTTPIKYNLPTTSIKYNLPTTPIKYNSPTTSIKYNLPTTVQTKQGTTRPFVIYKPYLTTLKQYTLRPTYNPIFKIKTTTKPLLLRTNTPLPPIIYRDKIKAQQTTVKNVIKTTSKMPLLITVSPKLTQFKNEKQDTKNNILNPYWTDSEPKTISSTSVIQNFPTTTGSYVKENITEKIHSMKYKSSYKLKALHKSSPAGKNLGPIVTAGIGLTTLLFVTLGVAVCYFRRRKINRRGDVDGEADVLFFTSDEVLDFTLARPSSEPSVCESRS